MKIKLITVGAIKNPNLKFLENDYVHKLKHYADVEFLIVPDFKKSKSNTVEQVRQEEAKGILKYLNKNKDFYKICLDENGLHESSEDFSDRLVKVKDSLGAKLLFVIGGPFGLDFEVVNLFDFVLSLSKMTLPHEFVKIMIMEQIFRGFEIIKGSDYHK